MTEAAGELLPLLPELRGNSDLDTHLRIGKSAVPENAVARVVKKCQSPTIQRDVLQDRNAILIDEAYDIRRER